VSVDLGPQQHSNLGSQFAQDEELSLYDTRVVCPTTAVPDVPHHLGLHNVFDMIADCTDLFETHSDAGVHEFEVAKTKPQTHPSMVQEIPSVQLRTSDDDLLHTYTWINYISAQSRDNSTSVTLGPKLLPHAKRIASFVQDYLRPATRNGKTAISRPATCCPDPNDTAVHLLPPADLFNKLTDKASLSNKMKPSLFFTVPGLGTCPATNKLVTSLHGTVSFLCPPCQYLSRLLDFYSGQKSEAPQTTSAYILLPTDRLQSVIGRLPNAQVFKSFSQPQLKALGINNAAAYTLLFDAPSPKVVSVCSTHVGLDNPEPFVTTPLNLMCGAEISKAPCTILLDTGASGSVFINATFARNLNLTIHPANSPLSISFGNSTSTQAHFTCNITIKIGKFSSYSQALLVDNLQYPVICGDPWLQHHKFIIDYENKALLNTRSGLHLPLPLQQSFTPPADSPAPEISLITAQEFAQTILRDQALHSFILLVDSAPEIPNQATTISNLATHSEPQTFVDTVHKVIPGNTEIDIRFKSLLFEYQNLFPDTMPIGLPPERNPIPSLIQLVPGHKIPNRPLFRYSPAEQQQIKKQLSEMLERQVIVPSTSPFGAPVLFVKKKTGELRMCIDYRELNKITIRNSYPLPRIDDLLDKLQGAKIFSSLDLLSGYEQIRLPQEDSHKTAFKTPLGLYQYKVLPFGLTNCPSVFQNVMNDIFRDLHTFVLVYMDDILIFSKTSDDHIKHLRQVFQNLQDQKMYIKLKKCDFFKKELHFLGHVVSQDGVKPDPRKVQVVRDMPVPLNQSSLREFLGLTNYFKKYIPCYAQIALPLSDQLIGNISRHQTSKVLIPWSIPYQHAFDLLKEALTTAPTLALPDFSQPFEVITDASDYALGAILLQNNRPIAYESRKLSKAEINYTTTEKELLAVVHALKTWRCYLEGVPFLVKTDHHPLVHLKSQPFLSRQQARWSSFLQQFDFQWKYIKGVENPSDTLSRLKISCQLCFLHTLSAQSPTFPHTQAHALTAHRHAAIPTPTVPTPSPSTLLESIKKHMADKLWSPSYRQLQRYGFQDGLFYHQNKVVVPPSFQEQVVEMIHSSPLSGHPGTRKTIELVSRDFFWPKLRKTVRKYISTCDSCIRVKASQKHPLGLLQPLPVPDQKWWVVTMDFITSLPESQGFNSILVFTDKLSKMVHFVPTKDSCTAQDCAILFLSQVVRLHGIPKQVISDRDVRWTSIFYQTFSDLIGTKHAFSTAFHPQTDGQTERVNKTLEDFLRHFVDPHQSNWASLLPMAEFAFNNTYHESIKTTPFRLNYGIDPLTPWSYLTPLEHSSKCYVQNTCPNALKFSHEMQDALSKAKTALEAANQRHKFYADKLRTPAPSFSIGDQVLLSTTNLALKKGKSKKLFPRFIGPFTIKGQINDVTYQLHLPAQYKLHHSFHVSLLRKYEPKPGTVRPPLPVILEEGTEFEVERIVDHNTVGRGKNKQIWYHVKWLGYDSDYNTWEPANHLKNSPLIVQEYWSKVNSHQKG